MGFTPKTDKPFPAPEKGKIREWAKKYFKWEQLEGELYATEISKLSAQWENGHPDYEPKETDMVTMSRTDLQKLLGDIETRITEKVLGQPQKSAESQMGLKEAMSDLADILNPTPGQRHRTRTTAEIDREDYLEEPVMFFTYKNYYSIHSETRYSHEEKTPYGRPIVFTNVSGHVTGNIKGGKQTVQISAAQIQTKKELEWMRKSPKFNVIFFEKIRDITDIDPVKASKLAEAMTEISSLTEYQVMQRAISAGIKPGMDVEQMRRQLIQLIANQNLEMQQAVSRNAASAADASLESTLNRGVSQQQVAGNRVMSY